MEFFAIITKSLWSGLFASSWALTLTAPRRYVIPAFFCGFAGRFSRDLFMSWGVSQNWSTVVAAALVVLVAVVIIRKEEVSPAVLVTGVLPLGAALALINSIIGLIKVSSLKGDALAIESATLTMNTGIVFITSLAIAVGLAGGMVIVRFINARNPQKEQDNDIRD